MHERVACLLKKQVLAKGTVLAREGDPGDALFLVIEGCIGFRNQSTERNETVFLGRILAGEVAGELALLTGHGRTATMFAEEPSLVATLSRIDFNSLRTEFPREMEMVVERMRQRLNGYQIRNAIDDNQFLKSLGVEVKSELESQFQWKELHAGDMLFREGDAGDALYLIVSGRIRLMQQHSGTDRDNGSTSISPGKILTELGRGDMFGEMALLTNETRSTAAIAARDTRLAALNRSAFDRIVLHYPKEILSLFACQMAARLRHQNLGKQAASRPAASICVLTCSPSAGDFATHLAKCLSTFGTTLHLNHTLVSKLSSHQPLSTEAAETRLLSWLDDQETQYRHVIYEADIAEDFWAHRCLRQADVLFLVADRNANPDAIIARLEPLLQRAACTMRPNLVLCHPDGEIPTKTRAWLIATKAILHWHIRTGITDDVARIARHLTDNSVGLVLGGGFAFGLAHIGVIQALRDLNVPIDRVGGTSMGSVISMACAFGFSREQMLDMLQEGCASSLKRDYTFPIVSLLSGRRAAKSIGSYVGDAEIEDLWLPYFAISSSLVHARMVVHTHGNALRSILASCRAPVIFPPLGWEDDVLVDGGLVNNVPCDVMRNEIGSGTVIGVDVSPNTDFSVREQFGLHLSGWHVARRRINPFSRRQKPATIVDIIARLIRLGGVAQLREIRSTADLYLLPPLEQFTFRDFHRGEEMSQIGYDYTLTHMQQWIAEHGRPWAGDASSEAIAN